MFTLKEITIPSIQLILLSGLLSLIFIYFKQKTIQIAEKASNKALRQFDNELKNKNTVTFRDEQVRNNLITHMAKLSIDIKIRLWQELYDLYFDYKKSWDFDKGTPLKDYGEINANLKRVQKNILINSIYLGGKLTISLSNLSALLIACIRLKYQSNKLGESFNLDTEIEKNHLKIDSLIDDVQTELNATLFTDQCLRDYEFTDEQLKEIFEIRKNQLKNLSE